MPVINIKRTKMSAVWESILPSQGKICKNQFAGHAVNIPGLAVKDL